MLLQSQPNISSKRGEKPPKLPPRDNVYHQKNKVELIFFKNKFFKQKSFSLTTIRTKMRIRLNTLLEGNQTKEKIIINMVSS